MKIYLDNCSFNRPFDNQTQIRIKIETDSKLFIQELIKKNKVKLIWSYILEYENDSNPYEERKEQISKWKNYAKEIVNENKNIINRAENLLKLNIKSKDALHIACSIEAKCKYYITTDDFLLKKSSQITDIDIVSPPTFIEMEDFDDN